jgi:predicted nuclease of predicted toxin-antitoxin system
MATDLRLLIDEAVQNDIAEEIVTSSEALKCKYVRDLTDLKSKSDEDVMAYAQRERRIVLTTEGKFDDKSFKICTHCGIIVIATRSTYRAAPALKRFLLSGHRKEAENAVTFINETGARVKKHGNVVTEYPSH